VNPVAEDASEDPLPPEDRRVVPRSSTAIASRRASIKRTFELVSSFIGVIRYRI
jgi:hypothetical protein